MSRYKAYPEYEKSKLQWADRTPKHWDSVHLRWIAKLYAGGTPSKAIEEYWENGSVPWINSGEVNQGLISEVSTHITEAAYKNSSAKWVPKNALVMALAGQGKTKGMIAQLAIDATCNQSMAAIVPQDLQSSRYLFWWLHSNYQNIRNMAGGDLRDGLNLELLGDIGCPIPTVEEQLSIAAFLDHETAKIDALIEKQQRLIELLKEKRQAVISHAVTKGLNPNAPMKDSGVEWLGEVPAHWQVAPLKRFADVIDCKHFTVQFLDEGFPIVSIRELRDDLIDISNAKMTSRSEWKFLREDRVPLQGDIIFCRNASVGAAGYVNGDFDFCMGQDVCLIRTGLANRYMHFQITSRHVREQIEAFLVGATIRRANVEEIRGLVVAYPPENEQKKIEKHLVTVLSEFDALSQKAERTVALLIERRTALISAAVTGKIDVRDWQAAA